jgi:hypothetical protein
VDFTTLDTGDDNHQASYSIKATVTLQRIIYGAIDTPLAWKTFELSEVDPSRTENLDLTTQHLYDSDGDGPEPAVLKDGGYRLQVKLVLQAEIKNWTENDWIIRGPLEDHYHVGTSAAPIALQAAFIDPNGQDSDGDGVPDSQDNCPDEPNADQADADGDGFGDACEGCPQDPDKSVPGTCGCGVADTDTDMDGTPDCIDDCPQDPDKTSPGTCGCGVPDADSDNDGTPDCNDGCPNDPEKTSPGTCGCGVLDSDTDTDGDGVIDCLDPFPGDPTEWEDFDGDGLGDNADPDDDNDEMPDDWETAYGLNPYDAGDAAIDTDEDGWNNLEEYEEGTDPTNPDDFPSINKKLPMPWIPLLLLSADESDPVIPSCEDLIADNCNLAAPDGLASSIEEKFEGTYVDFSWSPVECAPYYVIRIGNVQNLKNLPPPQGPESPYVEAIIQNVHRFSANFTTALSAPPDTYYWTVTTGCSETPDPQRGTWSVEESFEFPSQP